MKINTRLLFSSALLLSALRLSATTVCYDSHVYGGANDGSSWANAFSDLATAIAAAGDGGEVHVKQGIHYPQPSATGAAIQLLNIKLIGGYTGTDADTRSTDPRTTVFCGDIGNNDVYVDTNDQTIPDTAVEGTFGRAFNPATGAFINFRPWTAEEGFWKLSASTYSDNVQKLFTVPDTVTSDYEMRIEGITFTGFGRNNNGSIITTGRLAHMVITNCDFIANYSLPANYPGLINLQSDSNVEDCRFLGTHGGQIIYTIVGTPSTNAVVRGCEMKYIYSADAKMGCPAGVNARIGKCYLSVLDSDFDYFYARSIQYNAGGVVIGNNAGNPIAVDNCTIRHVTSLGNTTVANRIVTASTLSNSEISDCVFEGDSLSESFISATTLDNCKIIDNSFTIHEGSKASIVSTSGLGANQTPASNLSIVGNTVSGGTTYAAIINTATMVLMNSVVAHNKLVDYGTNCIAATFIRTGIAHVGWTTVYNNETPVEFYGNQLKNNHQVYLNSSVVWREAPVGSFSPAVSLLPSKGQFIFRHSCVKGVEEGSDYATAVGTGATSSIGIYTEDPLFAPVVRKSPDGGKYVMLRTNTPYRRLGYLPRRSLDDTASNAKKGAITFDCEENNYREVASNTNYHTNSKPQSDEPMADLLGMERTEGNVVLGAVQELYREDRTILTIQ